MESTVEVVAATSLNEGDEAYAIWDGKQYIAAASFPECVDFIAGERLWKELLAGDLPLAP